MEQIAIFCDTDDFCKAYEEYCRNRLLMDSLTETIFLRSCLKNFSAKNHCLKA